MTTAIVPDHRLLNQYLDAVLHAFSTGKRPHSDTREKIIYIIQAASQNDAELETYLRQEIDAYNRPSAGRRRVMKPLSVTEPTH
jgi:hypothetical protein